MNSLGLLEQSVERVVGRCSRCSVGDRVSSVVGELVVPHVRCLLGDALRVTVVQVVWRPLLTATTAGLRLVSVQGWVHDFN